MHVNPVTKCMNYTYNMGIEKDKIITISTYIATNLAQGNNYANGAKLYYSQSHPSKINVLCLNV